MKGFAEDFRAFAMKGNVIDLAVAVVIGGAFGKIVSSLVDTIITPLIGLFMGGIDFSSLSVEFRDASFMYGAFIQAIIDFLIIALVIFIMIGMIGKLHRKEEEKEEEKPAESSEEVILLREIRDSLKH
jgi:large conductance mechanosensitive channel